MTLSIKRIIKALIRLHGYAGWSAPFLFAHPPKTGFSQGGPFDCWHFSLFNYLIYTLLHRALLTSFLCRMKQPLTLKALDMWAYLIYSIFTVIIQVWPPLITADPIPVLSTPSQYRLNFIQYRNLLVKSSNQTHMFSKFVFKSISLCQFHLHFWKGQHISKRSKKAAIHNS